MICPKCGYDWEYKGKSNFYISCPRCRSNINLNKINRSKKGGPIKHE